MEDPESSRVPLASVLARADCFPVGVEAGARTLLWRDVGDCTFTHAVFQWSLEAWFAEHELGEVLQTDLAELGDQRLTFDAIPPSLFIFHMSRCGSSLLARTLALNPRVIVMSELPAVNALLVHLSGGELNRYIIDPHKRRMLRNLIAVPGRQRHDTDSRYAVKFSSWNVLQIQSIRAAWPDVPTLFMYRAPAEVLISLLQGPPGWARSRQSEAALSLAGASRPELDTMGDIEFVVRCLGRMMDAALSQPGVLYLNYTDLDAESLPMLLAQFGIPCDDAELAAMTEQFGFHSKAPGMHTTFVPDSQDKQAAIDESMQARVAYHLEERYAALECSPRNLSNMLGRGGKTV